MRSFSLRRHHPAVVTAVAALLLAASIPTLAAELTVPAVASKDGDGPDGKGNSPDDTWQFWFQLAHQPNQYRRLDLHSTTHPQGIPGKVTGPVGAWTPNPADTQGWIYHSDWDGRGEGFWGDAKAGKVLAHPYNEKVFPGDVAVTYLVPEDGTYVITTKATYGRGANAGPKAGIRAKVGVCSAAPDQIGGDLNWLSNTTAGAPGDPGVTEYKSEPTPLKKGQLVMLAIDANGFWGADMTFVDAFKIEPAAK